MNKYFFCFLLFLSTFFLFNNDFLFIGIVILFFCIFKALKNIKKDRSYLIFLLFFVGLGVCRFLLTFINTNNKEILGIVIKKKDNYFILFNGFNKFYVYNNSPEIDFLDLVRIKGNIEDFHFHALESSFDFDKYLRNSGVNKQIYLNSFNKIFNFPFDLNKMRNHYLDSFNDEKIKNFIGGMLLGTSDDNNDAINDLKFLNFSLILTLTGSYLNYFIKKISNIFSLFLSEKISYLIAFLLISPLFLLNIDKFMTYKIIAFFFFTFFNKYHLNNKFSKIEIVSIIGIFFLIINPFLCYQESFLVSFIISIFFSLSNLYRRHFKRIKLYLINLLLISLIVLPFQINRTNTINTFSLFNNLLISSVMRPLFIFIYFFYFILRLPIFNFLIVFIIKIMGNMNFNLLNINIPNIPNIFIFLYLLMVMIFFYFAEINYKSAAKRTILIVCIPLLIYCLPINNFFTFEISFINVGQGDSTLIRYKEQAVLIDTGGLLYQDVATNSLIPFLRSKRIYALDDVIITHDDYDHSGALDSLREHYLVKNVINKDSMFPFKLNNSCLFENLNSFNYQTNDENYKSLVVKVSLSDLTLLIMGDAPIEIEQKIIDKYKPFSCDFLKVGHHGSNTSSSEDFIKFIKPKIAIISCGYKNKFKHPSASVIKILEKYDITIRRTDLEGTISYKFWV